jgi:trehalose 6-phosphate phosphatase
MIDLQSAAGDNLLLGALGRKPLLALDFDGTLSPLVPQPAAAAMDPRVPPLLEPLKARMPVAIVSGRGIVDLAARVPVEGLLLVGNHGNEWDAGSAGEDASPAAGESTARARSAQQRQVCLDWAAALAGPLAAMGPGLAFEAKSVSLSIHFRLMADPQKTRLELLELIAGLQPAPEIIEGKFVLNLMAPGLVTKYEALVELQERERAGTVIFVGDDVTDERVFERAPADWLTVRVWDDEANAAAVASAARAFVQRVDGVIELLERIGRLSRNL